MGPGGTGGWGVGVGGGAGEGTGGTGGVGALVIPDVAPSGVILILYQRDR